jgi:glutathione S-transferase
MYELFYWPNFTGRIEPILLLLHDAGVDYTLVRDVSAATAQDIGAPAFASPILRQGHFTVAQTTAILQFLGRRHGYAPADMSEEVQANCLQLALNAADIWSEAYKARREDDEGAAFIAERLPRWLDQLERFFSATSGGGPFFFGTHPTYADFALLNVCNILDWMYCTATKACDFPSLKFELPKSIAVWKHAMQARAGVAAYLRDAEPVLYAEVALGGVLPTPEQIAAWRASTTTTASAAKL